jgi:hypothetical protein
VRAGQSRHASLAHAARPKDGQDWSGRIALAAEVRPAEGDGRGRRRARSLESVTGVPINGP